MFMPGIPNLVLRYFVEKNHQADNGGSAGHKQINRTTLSMRRHRARLKDRYCKSS
jgi:sucrose phosphorylase